MSIAIEGRTPCVACRKRIVGVKSMSEDGAHCFACAQNIEGAFYVAPVDLKKQLNARIARRKKTS